MAKKIIMGVGVIIGVTLLSITLHFCYRKRQQF